LRDLRVLLRHVGVVLAGELPVGGLDLVRRGGAGYPEHLVVVPFRHRRRGARGRATVSMNGGGGRYLPSQWGGRRSEGSTRAGPVCRGLHDIVGPLVLPPPRARPCRNSTRERRGSLGRVLRTSGSTGRSAFGRARWRLPPISR